MEAEQVVEKILSEARKEAELISEQSQQQQQHLQQELEQELAEYNEQTAELAQKAGKDQKEHLLSSARMDIGKRMLGEKRNVLNEVFKRAREEFKNLPDNEYVDIITKLMLKDVETGDEEVIVDPNENRINHKFIKEINRQLGTGFKGNLKLSERKEHIEAGYILQRGKIKNNASLDVLISEARNELEIELANLLFSN